MRTVSIIVNANGSRKGRFNCPIRIMTSCIHIDKNGVRRGGGVPLVHLREFRANYVNFLNVTTVKSSQGICWL